MERREFSGGNGSFYTPSLLRFDFRVFVSICPGRGRCGGESAPLYDRWDNLETEEAHRSPAFGGETGQHGRESSLMRSLALVLLFLGYAIALVFFLPKALDLPFLGLAFYLGAILIFRIMGQLE